MDLAFMPEFNGYKYFLVVIDVFSKHIYTRPLKEKTAKVVGLAFEDIYKEFESPIFKLESDNVIYLIANLLTFKISVNFLS